MIQDDDSELRGFLDPLRSESPNELQQRRWANAVAQAQASARNRSGSRSSSAEYFRIAVAVVVGFALGGFFFHQRGAVQTRFAQLSSTSPDHSENNSVEGATLESIHSKWD